MKWTANHKLFLAIAAAILAAVAIFCFTGCQTHAEAVPTTQAITAPALSARGHALAGIAAAKESEPYVSEPGKPKIRLAISEMGLVVPDIEQQIVASEQAAQGWSQAAQQLADEQEARAGDKKNADKRVQAEKDEGQARWQKEHDSWKWIGWKTDTYLKIGLTTIGGLLFLIFIMPIIGTIFPVIAPILGLLTAALKAVWHTCTLGITLVTPIMNSIHAKFDAWVESKRAPTVAATNAGGAK